MATAPVKSPLHNFPLPFLGWGAGSGGNSNSRCRRPIAGENSPEADTEAPSRGGLRGSRSRLAPCSAEKPKENNNGSNNDEAEAKPWNLRPRKVLFAKAARESQEPEAGISGENGGENLHNRIQNPHQAKSLRLRGLSEASQQQNQPQQGSEIASEKKRKFWIALSREEIEEDVFIMTGSRPARRPKKRPKNVQKQLDAVFPGLWLVGYSADAYRAAEAPAKR